MIRRLIVKILVTAVALWVADYLLADFTVIGGIVGYGIAGVVLGLLNSIVRPILKLIALPLILLTLGLFTVVINIAMLWVASLITGTIVIGGITALLWTTLIVSVMHVLFDSSTDE